jgi:hypothetical protein
VATVVATVVAAAAAAATGTKQCVLCIAGFRVRIRLQQGILLGTMQSSTTCSRAKPWERRRRAAPDERMETFGGGQKSTRLSEMPAASRIENASTF